MEREVGALPLLPSAGLVYLFMGLVFGAAWLWGGVHASLFPTGWLFPAVLASTGLLMTFRRRSDVVLVLWFGRARVVYLLEMSVGTPVLLNGLSDARGSTPPSSRLCSPWSRWSATQPWSGTAWHAWRPRGHMSGACRSRPPSVVVRLLPRILVDRVLPPQLWRTRDTRVVDLATSMTRPSDDDASAPCAPCFTTHERIAPARLAVVKSDGRREEFDRDKLPTASPRR
ncbi:MAG: hypothetical protein R3C32_06205 [Chloroflexota bacterium]